jgi:hypothetical protein
MRQDFELLSQEMHLGETGWKLPSASSVFGSCHCSCGNSMMEVNRVCYQGKTNGNDFFDWVASELMLQHLPCAKQLRHEIELDVL